VPEARPGQPTIQPHVLIYATFPNLETAEAIATGLLEARLAACVNLLPGMRALYRWQGKVHRDPEIAAIIKSRRVLAGRVTGFVRIAHPYVNPALLVLPVESGSADFLAWIDAETDAPDPS